MRRGTTKIQTNFRAHTLRAQRALSRTDEGEVCRGGGSQQQQQHKHSPWDVCTVSTGGSSLGLLLRVPLLLQPLGVALSHGVDDGNDEVADHDQHHLLKHPGEPVLFLEADSQGGRVFIPSSHCYEK